jgi:hypothetical protein
MSASLRREVWERAGSCCEYCQLPQEHDPRPFHLDHIRPQKHDGPTVSENLALCCAACSLFKGPSPAGYDPETDGLTPLFNPRVEDWREHFAWSGNALVGRTPVGRTTIAVLRINDPLRVQHRQLLIELGVFPNDSSES